MIRGNTQRPSFSAYTARTPSVSRQTMIFPHAVRSMKVTQTRYGVTLRNILMGLGSDQVRHNLPRSCFDQIVPGGPKHSATLAILLLSLASLERAHVYPGWTADGLGAAVSVAIRCTRWTSASLTLARLSTLTSPWRSGKLHDHRSNPVLPKIPAGVVHAGRKGSCRTRR